MKPKLLFISPSNPFPPTDGKRQRTLALLLASLQKFEVDFIALDGILGNVDSFIPLELKEGLRFVSMPPMAEVKWQKKLGIGFFPSFKIKRTLKVLLKLNSYDSILCRYAVSALNLPKGYRFILDVDDDYRELMRSKIFNQSKLLKKIRLYQIFYINLPFYKRILSRADQLIWVKSEKTNKRGLVLGNLPFQILLTEKPVLISPHNKDILFVGKLSYEPNSEGLRWFLENVWGKLRIEIPNSKLTIISSVRPNIDLEKLILDSEEVNLHINVVDLLDFYYNHKLSIVPVFFGGGSNVKISESLVMGRNIVSSEFGARGFSDWVNSGHISLANNSEEWVKSIKEMMNIPWKEEDWQKVKNHFSVELWNNKLLQILSEY